MFNDFNTLIFMVKMVFKQAKKFYEYCQYLSIEEIIKPEFTVIK
ncbi:hypothetical protein HNP36_003429 [Chryseobacterium shigense]|uniref:Uncharacterized protein n=1 Tax=Chryseobacterium shigense TaxID=297244 RepID=A0A841N701_9FLAO|nr:hypothetical protein [Chryseobacterium shigense]